MNSTKIIQSSLIQSGAVDFDVIYDRGGFGSAKWANQWDEFSQRVEGECLFSLWTADMDFRAPKTVVTRLREAAEHGIYGYTKRDSEHYRIVQSWFERRHGWSPELEGLLPALSIMSSVATIIRNFTAQGDGIIVQSPVYSPYFGVINGNGRVPRINQLKLVEGCYELDLDDFEHQAKSGARAFLLCNPHNPAGKAWSYDELNSLNAICEKYDILVISDDIHCDIRLNDRPHVSFASLDENAADRSFICTAPTKTFNLAGIPTATVSIANPKQREKFFAAMQTSFLLNANFFGRLALETAYQTGAGWLDELTVYVKGNADLVQKFACDNLHGIEPMMPDASFLVWLDARELDARVGNIQKFFVSQSGVNLCDGRIYGPGGEGFIRLNIGCPRPLLEKALLRMADALAKL